MESLKVVTWRIPNVRAADLERVTVPDSRHESLYCRLAKAPGLRGSVYLPTCQRAVVATVADGSPEDVGSAVLAAFAERTDHSVPEPEVLVGYQAFAHLAEVAASLDSFVPGEAQILGQMKDAYQAALDAGHVGKSLNHIFQLVFRTAKRVRTDTGLFEGKVSLIPLTFDLVEEHIENLDRPRAVVVGTGTIGRKMIDHLRTLDVDLTIVSRNAERAGEVAKEVGGTPMLLDDFLANPPATDVAALACRVDEPIVHEKQAEALALERPTLVLDLALPRNSAEAAGHGPDVRLIQMDDLNALSEKAKQQRHAEISRAREVLQAELGDIRSYYDNLHVDREVVKLRNAMMEAAEERFERGAHDLKSPTFDDPEFRKWYEQTVRHLVHVAQTSLRKVNGVEEGEDESS